MSRYITIPKPATFIDPGTKKPAQIQNEDGTKNTLVPRDHEWFMHVYMLSHLQFNIDVGGAEAARAAKDIGRTLEAAVLSKEHFYEVSDDSLRRLKCCMARASEEDYQAAREVNPDNRILAKSTLGMSRKMDNFTAKCFVDHFDAIENASTIKPEAPVAPPVEAPAEDRPDSASN